MRLTNNQPLLIASFILSCLHVSMLSADDKRPNFILILADDLGYGDVGFQGAPDIKTPHLDRFAKQGIRFTNMRANCTVCSPTRAAIMTGRYADRVGVPGVIRTNVANNWGYFDPQVPTIADRLGSVGYHSAIIGKWHLGLDSPNQPTERGFDHFHGFLGDMMDDYYTHLRGGLNFMRKGMETIEPKGHATELFTQWAIDYLMTRSENTSQPFFLYLPYNAPHFPIQPPDDWLARTKQQFPNMEPARAANVAFVEHLDDNLGKLFSALDQLELDRNTIVAFTSDNGGSLRHAQRNLPWRDGKQSHYDGGLRVPFLIRPTDKSLAGTSCDYVGMTFDLTATFLDLAGTDSTDEMDAVSLSPVLNGKPMPKRAEPRQLYFVRREGGNGYMGLAYHALIRGKWKLMRNSPFAPLELFDLQSDPEETTDVIGTHPKVANEMKRLMREYVQRGGRVRWQSSLEALQ